MASLDYDKIILQELLEKGASSFRALQKMTKISPRTLKRYLDNLEKREFIHREKDRDWKRGQKILYSIKERGIECFASKMRNDFGEILTRLQVFLSHYASDPNSIWYLREMTQIKPSPEILERGYVRDSEVKMSPISMTELRKLLEPREKMVAPIRQIIKAAALTLLKIEGPHDVSGNLENVTFRFTKEEGPYWIVDPIGE